MKSTTEAKYQSPTKAIPPLQLVDVRADSVGQRSEARMFIATAVVAAAAFLVLLALAAVGLRGTDQYWYTAEVEQILAGRPNESNVVFPYHAVHNLVPPPFNHHTLTHYLVLPFAQLFGAYHGWIVFNTLATLISAVLAAVLCRRLAGPRAAAIAFVASLFIPLVFWVTAQPYLETSLAVFVSLGMYLYVSLESSLRKWLLLLLVFVAAYWCRISFLPVLLLVPVGYFFAAAPGARRWVISAGLLAAAVVSVLSYRLVFTPDPALTLSRYLSSKVPGGGDNFHLLFAPGELPLDWSAVARKFVAGIKEQVITDPLGAQVFYLPFNVMAVLSVLFCLTARSAEQRRAALFILTMMGLHLLTICLRGNELRFLMVVQPALLLGAVLFVARYLSGISRKRFWAAGSVAVAALIALNVPLVLRMRSEAEKEGKMSAALAAQFDSVVPASDAIVVAARPRFYEPELMLGYAVRPRLVLFVKPNYAYTAGELEAMQRNVRPRWLFVPPDSPLIERFSTAGEPLAVRFPRPFSDRVLYRIMAEEAVQR